MPPRAGTNLLSEVIDKHVRLLWLQPLNQVLSRRPRGVACIRFYLTRCVGMIAGEAGFIASAFIPKAARRLLGRGPGVSPGAVFFGSFLLGKQKK